MGAQAGSDVAAGFAELARVLADLADAARSGALDRMVELQAEHETILGRLQASGARLADQENAETIARDIRAALGEIEQTLPRIERLRNSAQNDAADTRMQRKVSQSYR